MKRNAFEAYMTETAKTIQLYLKYQSVSCNLVCFEEYNKLFAA